MSKGPGRVMRAIADAFEAQPHRRFTTEELAACAYPGEPIEKRHTDAVTRAVAKIAPTLGLKKCRARPRYAAGWRNVWGL